MTNYEEFRQDLKKQYKKTALTIQEVASELGLSVNSIRLGIKAGKGIPNYKKVGGGVKRQRVVFPIIDVAKFLADTEKVY